MKRPLRYLGETHEKPDNWRIDRRIHNAFAIRGLRRNRSPVLARLGELVAAQVEEFNASQDEFTVVASHKGNYSETLNAGIAAFRAGEQPQILMVFEVGTATMMSAEGAVRSVTQVMEASGAEFDPDAYIGAVNGYYTTTEGEMLSLPFNASTPVLWVNRDAFEAAGVDPDTDLSTWQNVGEVLTQLKDGGSTCPLTTAWQSWIHLENFSAYHDVPFATFCWNGHRTGVQQSCAGRAYFGDGRMGSGR